MEMLRTRAHSDKSGRKLPQNGKPLQQTEHEWERSSAPTGGLTGHDATMNKDLHSLDQAGGPFPARLYLSQVVNAHGPALQLCHEQICCRDGVLNRKIDSHTSRRRHRVRRITYAKQSFAIPILQTIHLDGE